MSGDIEHGICDVCGEEGNLQRKYYHYDVDCKCCGGDTHFEIVKYCDECNPEPPARINPLIDPKPELTDKEELEILRDLLWTIGNRSIGAQKDGGKGLGDVISEIRYGYCYNQSNSYPGQTDYELKQFRINSLLRIKKLNNYE